VKPIALRRRALLRLAAAGGAAGASGWLASAFAKGDIPPGQGVVRLDGTGSVGGRVAAVGMPVALGERVATGPASQMVVVIGADAFLLRAESAIEPRGEHGALSGLRVATGKVLSVFAHKPVAIRALNASIGIRGTGCYIEVEAADVYFCLCYGEALVEGPGMENAKLVKTRHHEQPLILREDGGVMATAPGPFRNHTDAELILLESLVGREPPFLRDGASPAGKY
jgi:hypothetical protein